MKSKLISVVTIILLVLSIGITVQASSSAEISLIATSQKVKMGETFTVTLSATCSDGINGIDTTYSYDTDKLELISANVADSNKWASLGTDNQITVICNSSTKITEAEIYVLTFKVKETATAGDTANINISETLLDSDAATNSEVTLSEQQVSITVSGENGEEKPSEKPENGEGKPSEKPDGGEEKPSDEPNDTEENEDSNSTVVKVGDTDNSTSPDKLPYAGRNLTIIMSLITLITISVILFRTCKKYKNI